MSGRLDPPHERVTLSPAELRTIDELELAFDGDDAWDEDDEWEDDECLDDEDDEFVEAEMVRWTTASPPPSVDVIPARITYGARLRTRCYSLARAWPWIVAVGAAILLATIALSPIGAVFGGAVLVVGLCACLWRQLYRR